METKMVTCAICNKQVSKRQSILIESYGRICRNHPEVEQHKAKLAETAEKMRQDKKLEEAMKSLQVMTIVEQIRMTAKVTGHPLSMITTLISFRLPKDIREKVKQEVFAKGPVSDKELEEAIGMAVRFATKGFLQESGEQALPVKVEEVQETNEEIRDMDEILPLWLDDPKKENGGTYKYVRFADGKVLFVNIQGGFSHRNIVDFGYTHPKKDGDKLSGLKPPAVSAGKITVRCRDGKRIWCVSEAGSISANLPRLESDEKYIQIEI
ncbi:MAG: hypothetical protein ABFD50_12755 [Smithella sp.]